MSGAEAVIDRLSSHGPYFTLGTGPTERDDWRPASVLLEPGGLDDVVDQTGRRLGVHEERVAASTFFFGYTARLWSLGLGSALDGACLRLDPASLLWRSDQGTIHLHCVEPAFGGTLSHEVLHAHLVPLVEALSLRVAPGLLWGNAASALRGAARVLRADDTPQVTHLMRDPLLRGRLDHDTGRRRSCCLFYRTPTGGLCGDCVLPDIPYFVKETP